jgi:hypothetical protein
MNPPATRPRPLDPLQAAATGCVALLVAGQLSLLAWILTQPHPRRGPTDIVRGKSNFLKPPTTSAAPEPDELPPLPATDSPPAAQPPALNRMLRITGVDRHDAADHVQLRIPVKAQVGERELEKNAVAISVQFLTRKSTEPVWLAIPVDWDNFSTRAFSVRWDGSPFECTGYVVRTYYRQQLQDQVVVP